MTAITLSATSRRQASVLQAFVLAALLVFGAASGASAKSWMGVQVGTVPEALAEAYELPPGVGVYVLNVEPDGPAAWAGMERGDILIEIDGQIQLGPRHLQHMVSQRAANDTVWVGLYRYGEAMSGPVTLAEPPASAPTQAAALPGPRAEEPWY